jgi:long-subunit fatty acid transport protein
MNIKNSLKTISLAACTAICTNALADEKLWTVSTGLSYRNSNFNLPNNKFGNESWSGNLGLSRRIDDKTSLGGSISYSAANTKYDTLNGRADVDTTSLSVYLSRNVGWGLYANASLGYGKSDIDTNTAAVNYKNDASFKTASVGLTQYIPLGYFMANVGARYTHISSDSDKFITNLGDAVPSSGSTLNFITLGGQVTYRLNKWSPFVGLDWNKASREFVGGTGDKDYFSYSLGTRYTITNETSIGLTLNSVFDKRNVNENGASFSLSHQF